MMSLPKVFINQIQRFITNIALLLISLALIFFVVEFSFRVFAHEYVEIVNFDKYFPKDLHPKLGTIFVPNTKIKWTNNLEFKVEQMSNSYGFLDYEHVLDKPAGVKRILIIGDSFVEAAQVSLEQKFHVLLEKKLNATVSNQKYETIALGLSGYGTTNELALYEELGRKFKPDLTIIVFVHNDFMNNSPVLEAFRNGWTPHYFPRLFYEKKANGYVPIPVNMEWQKHLVNVDEPNGLLVPDAVFKWSYFYKWVMMPMKHKRANELYYEKIRKRSLLLSKENGYESVYNEIYSYGGSDFDKAFFKSELSPIFNEALAITDFSIKKFKKETLRDHSKLLFLITESCSMLPNKKGVKDFVDKGCAVKIRKILEHNKIQYYDLYDEFLKLGDPEEAHFKRDRHWNATGHSWVADILFSYVTENTSYLKAASMKN
nr:Lipolytic enzyme, G-D-S-L family [uncultured bacterium]